ncbi:hypothetical protein QBC33DRAFT_497166 [Phialemonium atrogriseum]|uniref:MYND-type domain-containing protein n=1 Tax=Phialemonium atrogriseum TaxID=1093897 RepID=A0AAJ0BWC7_9PEZI|nr:uncharacterized protein QBC33DRAFT_497166 [Phialemonium atrogriseum]KAK1764628.1 hypothetical protein QBC33DRAFT_497166 [Phialemonium atrogriseum]
MTSQPLPPRHSGESSGNTKDDPIAVHDLQVKDAGSFSQAAPSVHNLCNMCESEGTKACGKCGDAYYCSAECQRSDWPMHKILCKAFSDFKSDKRPSPEHFRAVIFPMTQGEPEFVWLGYNQLRGTTTVEHPDLGKVTKIIGRPALPTSATLYVPITTTAQFSGKGMAHALCIWGLQVHTTGIVPELLNQSQAALGKPGLLRPWFGPHIHVAITQDAQSEGAQNNSKAGDRDITMRDFRHIVDFYQNYKDNPCIANPDRSVSQSIPAIKISSTNDPFNKQMGITDTMRTVKVQAPLQTDRFQTAVTLANLVGLSWWLRDGNPITSEGIERPWKNADARYLDTITVACTVDDRTYAYSGTTPLQGSVLVMHAKGLPLDFHHIWAFNEYLDLVMITRGIPSKPAFKAYWARYKDVKARSGICMDNVPSPYDLEDPELEDILDTDAKIVRKAMANNTAVHF